MLDRETEIILIYVPPLTESISWVWAEWCYTRWTIYEPVVLLVTPKKKQVVTAGGRTADHSVYLWLFGEISLTNNNLNTFSHQDKGDNIGYALKGGIVQEVLHRDTTHTRLKLTGNYQFLNRLFWPGWKIPSRSEFECVTGTFLTTTVDLMSISQGSGLIFSGGILAVPVLKQNISTVKIYTGASGIHFMAQPVEGFYFQILMEVWMTSNDSLLSTRFLRHQALLSKQVNQWW